MPADFRAFAVATVVALEVTLPTGFALVFALAFDLGLEVDFEVDFEVALVAVALASGFDVALAVDFERAGAVAGVDRGAVTAFCVVRRTFTRLPEFLTLPTPVPTLCNGRSGDSGNFRYLKL